MMTLRDYHVERLERARANLAAYERAYARLKDRETLDQAIYWQLQVSRCEIVLEDWDRGLAG